MPPLLGSNSPVWVAVVESKTRGKTSFSHIQADSVTQDRVRKTDTSPETTHCHPDHVMSRDICPHMSRDFLGFWGGCFGSFVRFGFGVFQDICPFFGW